ncbi:hypothetical protein PV325_009640, partial [Microctonus aethiopoides]
MNFTLESIFPRGIFKINERTVLQDVSHSSEGDYRWTIIGVCVNSEATFGIHAQHFTPFAS